MWNLEVSWPLDQKKSKGGMYDVFVGIKGCKENIPAG